MKATIEVDRLADGISEQPSRQRLPGHVETALNIIVSVADGASKRPGSIFVTVISSSAVGISPALSGSAYRLHPIERDSGERYLVLYGDSTLRVFHEDGTEATVSDVSAGAAAEAYIDSGNATHDQLRVRTFADTTFVVNSTVASASEAAASFDIERVLPTPSDVFSFSTTVNNYLRAETDDDVDQAGYFRYTLSGDTTLTYGHINGPTMTDAWAQPNAGNWKAAANNPMGFRIAVRRLSLTGADFPTASWTFASRTLTVTGGGFTNYTFRAGDMIYVDAWAGTGTDARWYEVESKTSNDAIVLKSGQPYSNADETDTVDLYDSDSVCRIGKEVEIGFDLEVEGSSITTMQDIADVIQRELRGANLDNACCAWIQQPGGGGAFQITGPYRSSFARVYQPTAPSVAGVYDLTAATRPLNGVTVINGAGTLGSASDTMAPESRWTRVAAPAQAEAAPNEATMPCQLVRTAIGPPATFQLNTIAWDSRTDGDEITNPIPTFIDDGAKVYDVAIHRNRLTLLAGDMVFFSQDGDLFNLFATDAENTVDSDPIEVTLGGDQAALGDFLVPYRNAIQAFTKSSRQFDLAGGSERLTQETIQLNPTTKFTTASVRPQPMGNLLYFIATADDGAALLEYEFDDLSVSTRTGNVSIHTPSLLPITPKTIAVHPTSGLVFILPAVGRNLYVYRTYFSGGEKRQSAWTQWQIDDTISIIDIAVLGDRLYMLTSALSGPNQYVIEYIPIGREDAETGYPYAVHLDRRKALTGVYNGGGNYTEFDLTPMQSSGSTINSYVKGPAFATPGEYSIDASGWTYIAPPSNLIRIPGNLSAGQLIFGRYFTTNMQLSRPYRRDENGRAKGGELLTLIDMWVDHMDSGEYDVVVARTGESDHTTSFDAGTGVIDAEGFLHATLGCNPDEATVTITDTSPRPFTIAGYQIEADAAGFAR